uniref:Uncharacterized protein n=1 Tax=Anopheles christyi TaxID=43041 RepID=A0A182KHX2_9DIPT
MRDHAVGHFSVQPSRIRLSVRIRNPLEDTVDCSLCVRHTYCSINLTYTHTHTNTLVGCPGSDRGKSILHLIVHASKDCECWRTGPSRCCGRTDATSTARRQPESQHCRRRR